MAEEEIEIDSELSDDYDENVFILDKNCGFNVEHELVESNSGFTLYAPEAIADLGDGTLFDSMLTYNEDVKKYLLKTNDLNIFIEMNEEQIELVKDILHKRASII